MNYAHPVICVGQVWASTHKDDIEYRTRQRRRVVSYDERYVWLKTEDGFGLRPTPATRVMHTARGIKGHRLVEDAA
jgi:hypothetical protein